MKKNYTTGNATRLTAYSAMAVALTANVAKSEVIYTDPEDILVEIDGSYSLDVDADGVLDFYFRAGMTTGSSGTWSFASGFGMMTSVSVGNSNNQFIGYVGPYYNYGSALEYEDIIGPDGPWLSYPSFSNSAVLASNFYGVTYGAFPGQGERYLGFKFSTLGSVHYGWMRITAEINPAQITILDYAYENVPDAEILAGSLESTVAIPTIPAGEVQVYSFNSTLYIQLQEVPDNGSLSIYDMLGKQVYSGSLTEVSTQVDLGTIPTGNFIVQIISAGRNYSKQVYIN